MALITLHSTQKGINRLLAQPASILSAPSLGRSYGLAEAPSEHRDLFRQYVFDLSTAYEVASDWWEGTIAAQEALGNDREMSVQIAFDNRVAGGAAHPRVVWIVRHYWLECVRLNRGPAAVFPEDLLLKWLIEEGEEELVRLVACMPYWPIGLDADGNWC